MQHKIQVKYEIAQLDGDMPHSLWTYAPVYAWNKNYLNHKAMSARCMPDADAWRDAPDATRRSPPRQARNVECFHQLTLTHFRLAHYKSQIKSLFTKYYRDFRFRNRKSENLYMFRSTKA